jgi:hypothetical protein
MFEYKLKTVLRNRLTYRTLVDLEDTLRRDWVHGSPLYIVRRDIIRLLSQHLGDLINEKY